MFKKFLILTFWVILGLNIACGSAANSNTNSVLNQNTNVSAIVIMSPTPIPEMSVASPTPENNSNTAAAKTPGPTPAMKNVPVTNQQSKPAATPANNIPDAETLRRQMQRPVSNSNVSRDPNDGMMMKRSNSNGGSMMKRSSNRNQ